VISQCPENQSIESASPRLKLLLMYAGSIGRKDYLGIMLAGLSLLSKDDLAKVEFRIFGVRLNGAVEETMQYLRGALT